MQGLLKSFNLAAQLVSFLSTISIANLVMHRRVLLAQSVQLNLLLINDASQGVNNCLKLRYSLQLTVSELDRVTLIRELLTSNLSRLLLDSSQLFFSLVLQVGGDL